MDSQNTLRSSQKAKLTAGIVALCLAISTTSLLAGPGLFDISPFAHPSLGENHYKKPTTFDYSLKDDGTPQFLRVADHFVCALQWEEERDVQEVNLRFASAFTNGPLRLDYWCSDWPYQPPAMPSIEDPVDDPWRGHWIPAEIQSEVHGRDCRLTFQPLKAKENENASNLPDLSYRRTLKLRLISEAQPPTLEQIKVFSGSIQTNVAIRIELGTNGAFPAICEGRLTAYNGSVHNTHGWQTAPGDRVEGTEFHFDTHSSTGRKGLVFDVNGCQPSLPGSQDTTLVTFRSKNRTFTFALPDVQNGPMYLPDFDAMITLASSPEVLPASIVKTGQRIRERLAHEPEQTYKRASKEIPALDPVERQNGRLYLPLTIDSSWQKFAFSWGGSVFISKFHSKAKANELKRMEWQGDEIKWRLGTGTEPNFRPAATDTKMSILEDCLPVVSAVWTNENIVYQEEAFATALTGPLGWKDRDEQSPVVLMIKLTAHNTASQPQASHVWLGIAPSEDLQLNSNEVLASDGQLVRARITPSKGAKASLADFKEGENQLRGLHFESTLAPSAKESTYLILPFIPRLSETQRQRMSELDYAQERSRVVDYWRSIADNATHFDIPEKRFVSFGRSTVVHIHLSTTKDPKSGLFMVPAASYTYQVYANESCFQVLALDALGDHQTATDYLETFIKLQGSRGFRCTSVNQDAVYHGAKVSDEYDYTASEYNLDHGTVLWTLAEHFFMTRDKKWLEHALPGMIRAADWIVEQRHLTMANDNGKPVSEYGLLPAGNLEDNPDWAHWFAINAYASIGMTRLGDALREIQHPEANRICKEARAYRSDLRQAILRATEEAPVTRLRDNTYIPYVPVHPHQHFRLFGPMRTGYYNRYPHPVQTNYRLASTREVLYGPMILLNLDIFEGSEPLATWVLDDWEDNLTMSTSFGLNVHGWVEDNMWFSQGGMVFQANLQNPVLPYLRRGEVPAAIRNLYNDFVSCLYPDVNAFTEEYHEWKAASGPFYKVPDEARFVSRVCDLLVHEQENELWLTFGTPRRWLAPGNQIHLTDMPTPFGPVTLDLAAKENEIEGKVKLPTRNPASKVWLVLRVPENKKIASVEINGKPCTQFNQKREAIQLPTNINGPLHISAKLIAR